MGVKLLLAVLLLGLLNASATGVPPAAAATECLVYEIEATTETWGGTYSYEGVLVVYPEAVITHTGTRSPANEWEFWFQLGKPLTSPSPGAIFFSTNSALTNTTAQAAAQLQLADISWNEDGYFDVEPRLYESQQLINVFNAYGGLLAEVYTVTAGGMAIAFSEDLDEVQAVVSFLGRSMTTVATRADTPFEAEIVGRYEGTSTSCVTAGR